jgi:hypothetical protein
LTTIPSADSKVGWAVRRALAAPSTTNVNVVTTQLAANMSSGVGVAASVTTA